MVMMILEFGVHGSSFLVTNCLSQYYNRFLQHDSEENSNEGQIANGYWIVSFKNLSKCVIISSGFLGRIFHPWWQICDHWRYISDFVGKTHLFCQAFEEGNSWCLAWCMMLKSSWVFRLVREEAFLNPKVQPGLWSLIGWTAITGNPRAWCKAMYHCGKTDVFH